MSNFDYASYNRKGQLFTAANVSAKSVIAVTTGMTGVILHNPIGSNKLVVVGDVGFVWTTAPAAVHNIGLAILSPQATQPSSLTAIGSGVLAANGTGNAGVAKAYDAATLAAAPTIVRWLGGAVYGSGVGESPYSIIDKVDGALVLVPGATMCFAAVTTTAVGMGHVSWAEVPV
jgi:hypothetical protein